MNDFEDKMNSAGTLPEPDDDARQVSEALVQSILQRIRQQGPIRFADYMNMALYQPGQGYYVSGAQKFGRDGDFITASEVSPLFGHCVGRFCQSVLSKLESGGVLEFGAGSGLLAVDILTELEQLHALPEQYLIVEISPSLQQRQQQTLQDKVPHLLDRVQWLQTLPAQFSGVIVANEVLDAMPVNRFSIADDVVQEWMVDCSAEGQLHMTQQAAGEKLTQAVRHIEQYTDRVLPDGYVSEVCLAQAAWLEAVQAILQQGVILLIDYGYGRNEYYHPERSMGTFMCYYRHRAHDDAFWYPGLEDMTAYVDFTRIAEVAVEHGLDVGGYAAQAGFLLENGLDSMAPDPETTDTPAMLQFAQQVKTLTLPSEMGERFKVMVLSREYDEALPGFYLQDQIRRL